MKKPLQAVPAFSELSHDIANAVPPELVREWGSDGRSEGRAIELLARYRIRGMVASSDMTGLSRMTQRQPLAEVLRLVSMPKETIHAMTTGIGGEPIGTWIADNTETFFPESVAPDLVLQTVLEIQHRIPDDLPKLGFCIHHGDFFRVGGGLYGADADLVESVAEEDTGANETVVSASVVEKLAHPADFQFQRRDDLADWGDIYRVLSGPRLSRPALGSVSYPAPYPDDVRHALKSPESVDATLGKYRREGVALMVELCEAREIHSLSDLLDELLGCALLDLLFRKSIPKHQLPFKTGGPLALAVFETVGEAFAASLALRSEMEKNDMRVRCGIDSGGMLVFPMPGGLWEFAGDPINLASKQAEDCGQPGWIYLTERAATGLRLPSTAERFRWELSGITIASVGIPPA